MKLMIASDLHGSAFYTKKLLDAWDRESADRLLLLGDILYHGPRNPLPEGYAPQEVTAMLNARKTGILCVRGNCDSEVDQMVLDFPIMADYCLLYIDGVTLFATHGHIFHEQNLPMLNQGDVLLNGHTHVDVCHEHDTYLFANPGSISLPKKNGVRGYILLQAGELIWKTLEGEEIRRHAVLCE